MFEAHNAYIWFMMIYDIYVNGYLFLCERLPYGVRVESWGVPRVRLSRYFGTSDGYAEGPRTHVVDGLSYATDRSQPPNKKKQLW